MRGAIPAYPVVGLVQAPVFLPRLAYRQAGHFYLNRVVASILRQVSIFGRFVEVLGDNS